MLFPGNDHRKWKGICFSCTAKLMIPSLTQAIYIENTCKLQVEASIWKVIFWMWRFFSLSPDSLLPWQQLRIRSKWSWACRGMAVPNKQALSLTVSRVLLLLPSLFSPYPLSLSFLTSLPSFNIRLLLSSSFALLVSTHPSHLTDSPFVFVFLTVFLHSLPPLSPLRTLCDAFAFYYLSLVSSVLMLYLTLICLVFK